MGGEQANRLLDNFTRSLLPSSLGNCHRLWKLTGIIFVFDKENKKSPVWAEISIILTSILSVAYALYLTMTQAYVIGPINLIGLTVMSLGSCLSLAAKTSLGAQYYPMTNSYQPHENVFRGVHKFIRSPIYTARITYFLGISIATGSTLLSLSCMIFLAAQQVNTSESEGRK